MWENHPQLSCNSLSKPEQSAPVFLQQGIMPDWAISFSPWIFHSVNLEAECIGSTLTCVRQLGTQQRVKCKADVHSWSSKVWKIFINKQISVKVQVGIGREIYASAKMCLIRTKASNSQNLLQ